MTWCVRCVSVPCNWKQKILSAAMGHFQRLTGPCWENFVSSKPSVLKQHNYLLTAPNRWLRLLANYWVWPIFPAALLVPGACCWEVEPKKLTGRSGRKRGHRRWGMTHPFGLWKKWNDLTVCELLWPNKVVLCNDQVPQVWCALWPTTEKPFLCHTNLICTSKLRTAKVWSPTKVQRNCQKPRRDTHIRSMIFVCGSLCPMLDRDEKLNHHRPVAALTRRKESCENF